MLKIKLPQIIIIATDNLMEFPTFNSKTVTIYADKEFFKRLDFEEYLAKRYKKRITQQGIIVNENIKYKRETKAAITKNYNEENAVIIGNSEFIAKKVSELSVKHNNFTIIPTCGLSLSQSESSIMPTNIIIDSSLIRNIDSGTVAYNSMTALAYSLNCYIHNEDPFLHSLAETATIGILKYIVPAYRGDIESLQKLHHMLIYAAIVQYNNSNTTLLDEVSDFFYMLGCKKTDVAAVCFPTIVENENESYDNFFAEIFKKSSNDFFDYDITKCKQQLFEKIRHIQAVIGIPRSINSFKISDDEFKKAVDKSSNHDILNDCFYGSLCFSRL